MMNRSVKVSLSAWCLLLSAAVFAAEPQANLERKTTIDVTAASPKDVYASLAKVLGCELILALEIQAPLSLRIPNVTVRTALNAISESLGASWQLAGGKLHVGPASAMASSGVAEGIPGGKAGGVGAGVSRGKPGGVVGGVSRPGVGSGLGSGQGSGQGSGSGAGIGSGVGGVSGGIVGGVQGGVVGGVKPPPPPPPPKYSVIRERLDRKTPADFRFDNALTDDVLSAVSKILGMEVRINGLKAGIRVTLDLSNQTVLSALKAVQEQVGGKGLIFVLDAAGKEKVHFRMKETKVKK